MERTTRNLSTDGPPRLWGRPFLRNPFASRESVFAFGHGPLPRPEADPSFGALDFNVASWGLMNPGMDEIRFDTRLAQKKKMPAALGGPRRANLTDFHGNSNKLGDVILSVTTNLWRSSGRWQADR